MHKTLLKVLGIILGVVTIVLALNVFDMSVGSYESNLSYGGDAYTGIQNAAAQTANNVKYVGEMIRTALGYQLLVAGLAILFGSLSIRTKEKTPAPVPEKTAPAPQPFTAQPYAPQPAAPVAPVSYKPPVPTAPTEWRCAKCGTLNEADGKFCYTCGTPKNK